MIDFDQVRDESFVVGGLRFVPFHWEGDSFCLVVDERAKADSNSVRVRMRRIRRTLALGDVGETVVQTASSEWHGPPDDRHTFENDRLGCGLCESIAAWNKVRVRAGG